MSYSILYGDALDTLRDMRDESVQCVVTSPPYWGLRDYKCDGQIGLEKTPQEYVAKIVEVFREVRRVLANDGVLWLNLGDSYAGSWGNYGGQNRGNGTQRAIARGSQVKNKAYDGTESLKPPTANCGLKPKDLIGIPWMVAFALRDDGWYLRSDIVWQKPNTMPESVKDRPTRCHEYIFLLSKSARYYYDADAIKEPCSMESLARISQPNFENQTGGDKEQGGNRSHRRVLENLAKRNSIEARKARAAANLKSHPTAERNGIRPSKSKESITDLTSDTSSLFRNKRDVWTVPPAQFRDAHFATFPQKLIEPCILAGSRPGDTVLDPFCGSGTTLEVAIQHGRVGLGIELNAEYIAIAKRRLEKALPLLAGVTA